MFIAELSRKNSAAMKIIISGLFLYLFGCTSAQAQYYYQDIRNIRNTMQEHDQYSREGVRKIRIRSYDANQSLNQDFHCVKTLSDDFRHVITRTGSFQTGNSVIISSFDDSNRVIRTTDSTAMSVNDTYYYYDHDRSRQIDSIQFISYAVQNKDTFRFTETHIYQYNPDGRLLKMIRRKNNALYSEVAFTLDTSGQIIKEWEQGKYDTVPPVYYKYNATGQLTDIFHYSAARHKMMPDYLFDYDSQNRLSEKTTVTMNTNNYLLWKYFYNDKGLISQEECYGKKHALLGVLKFEYSY
jgi:hypothetical protein